MTTIILGAGYATRLYPCTLGGPKALVRIGGKTLLDRIIEGLGPLVDRVIIVTNSRFIGHFSEWLRWNSGTLPRSVIIWGDATTSDYDKTGATRDLALVIDKFGIKDDLIVVAPDNIFSIPLSMFADVVKGHPAPIVGVYDVVTKEKAREFGVIETDETGRITRCTEKPDQPATTLVGVGLYYYPWQTLPFFAQYLYEGNNPDQPGRFVAWLCERATVQTWRVPGIWYDIGSKESLEAANRIFNEQPATT